MRFEWDEKKDRANRTKHDLAFADACGIFNDPHMLTLHDAAHSDDEERWVTMGLSGGVLLVAVHTYRMIRKKETVRIISARTATRKEQAVYFSKRGGR
jgi:hypothetical protein